MSTYSHLTQTQLEWVTNTLTYIQLQPAFIPVTTTGTLTFNGPASSSVLLSNVRDPVGVLDAANKQYVDGLVNGLSWKNPVRAATTTSGTLASDFENGDTIDGVVLATGNRILIKNQADPIENGIYVVNATGAPTRAADMATGTDAAADATFVEEGTANADTAWVCTTNSPATVGTTGLTFVKFATLNPGTAAGANTQVQFNNGGDFGASVNFTFTSATNILAVTGTGSFTTVTAAAFNSSGTLNVVGISTLGATTSASLGVTGAFTVAGLSTLSSTTASGLAVTNGLNVAGSSVLAATTVTGPLRVTADATFTTNVTINGNLIVNGDIDFTTLASISVGTLTVSSSFESLGTAFLNSTTVAGLAVTSQATIGGSLSVTGLGSFTTNVSVTGDLSAGFVTAGAGSFAGALNVAGSSNLAATSISTTLNVAGVTNLSATTVNGPLNVTGVGSFTTNVTIAGDLTVNGNILFNTANISYSTLTVTDYFNSQGRATMQATTIAGLAVTNNQTIGGTLGVTGSASFTTNVSVGGDLSVIGVVTAGSGSFAGTLTVSGVSTLSATTVNGLLKVTGASYADEYFSTSDIQYKTNINSIGSDPLQKLKEIECYSYQWKESFSKNNRTQYGVIAQQLEEIGFNELVVGTESKAVNYQGLIPLLIASYQQQQKTIEQLQDDLNKLKTKKLIPK